MNELSQRIRYALQRAKLSQTAAAEQIGVTPQSVNKWLKSGQIDKVNLAKLADITGFTLKWFLQGPEEVNYQFDAESGLASFPGVRPSSRPMAMIPLISYVQAGAFCEAVDSLAPNDAEDWLPCPYPCGHNTFALTVRGSSMEDEFFDGEIIFVDPDRQYRPGDFVIAKKPDQNEVTFKRLQKDGDSWYLKAMNKSWPEQVISITGAWNICGVVIGKYKRY